MALNAPNSSMAGAFLCALQLLLCAWQRRPQPWARQRAPRAQSDAARAAGGKQAAKKSAAARGADEDDGFGQVAW